MSRERPLVSVVVEGYNESLSLGRASTAIDALLEQDFPLDQVEVILVREGQDVRRWNSIRDSSAGIFHSLRSVGLDRAHYYDLKNHGAQLAQGEILVLLDSDTIPDSGWLSAVVDGLNRGAAVQAGITTFIGENGWSPEHPLMVAAASISWGFIVPSPGSADPPRARGFLSHNVAFRTELFRKIRFRSDLGRTCAGSFLSQALIHREIPIAFNPRQKVAHVFSMKWWLTRLHVRFGYEVYRLRRLDPSLPHSWVRRLGWLEPLLVGVWHMLLDLPQWRRTCVARHIPFSRQVLGLPPVVLLSFLARSAEIYGMYATLMDPERMEKFAASN